MIEKYLNDKLLYKKGKNVFINKNNAVEFLQNENITNQDKIKFLEYIRILEDYSALNNLLKNFSLFNTEIRNFIITLINELPFVKIKDSLKKLLYHRDNDIKLNTLKSIRKCSNPDILNLIKPLTESGNQLIKINAWNSYYLIINNIISNDFNVFLYSDDQQIKESAYESVKNIINSHKNIEELIDSPVASEFDSVQKTENKNSDKYFLLKTIKKIEKNQKYTFISIISIFILLTIIFLSNFHFHNIQKDIFAYNNITNDKKGRVFSFLKNEETKQDKIDYSKINSEIIKNYFEFKSNLREKNFTGAASSFFEMSEYSADNIDEYIQLITGLKKSGELDTAVKIGKKLLYLNSNKINETLLSLYKETDVKKALQFERVFALNDIETLNMGFNFYKNKDLNKTLFYVEKLISLSKTPLEKEAYIIKLHDIYQKQGKIEFFSSIFDDLTKNLPETTKLKSLKESL
ncbi:MAG: hypothetical protein ACQESP_00075 [Candidatus Muiribacteriota bacterium]